jgi:hypothetical protein
MINVDDLVEQKHEFDLKFEQSCDDAIEERISLIRETYPTATSDFCVSEYLMSRNIKDPLYDPLYAAYYHAVYGYGEPPHASVYIKFADEILPEARKLYHKFYDIFCEIDTLRKLP